MTAALSQPPSVPSGIRITISLNSPRGRAVYATKSYPPGSVIATFPNPIIALPDTPHLSAKCAWCLRTSDNLKACSACAAAFYCAHTCQKTHWRAGHRPECEILARMRRVNKKVSLPTSARALLQILLRWLVKDPRVLEAFGPQGVLESHLKEFQKDPMKWADCKTQAMGVLDVLRKVGNMQKRGLDDLALLVLCQMSINTFSLDGDNAKRAGGIYLDLVPAMINHSCIPNAFLTFSLGSRAGTLRSFEHIEKGSEILISYIDHTQPKGARHEALNSYHFACDCLRCRDDLDVYHVAQVSPLIELNICSLSPDLSRLRHPPINRAVLSSKSPYELYRACQQVTAEFGASMEGLRRKWQLCRPLVQANMFAAEPLPSVMLEYTDLAAPKGRYAYALSVALFLQTRCDPYKFVAPFAPWRTKGLTLTAGLVSQVAPLAAAGKEGQLGGHDGHTGLVRTLCSTDLVTMCELLLRLAFRWRPLGSPTDTDQTAESMLGDISALQGRTRISHFIQSWAAGHSNREAASVVEQVVLKPLNEIADFAIDVLDTELGTDTRAFGRVAALDPD